MENTKVFGCAVCVLFVMLTALSTSPMPLFAMIEGGGGGTPPPPTWPKTVSSPELISSSGYWDDFRYVAYTRIETQYAVLRIDITVTYYSTTQQEANVHVASTYSYKGTRWNQAANNDGTLNYFSLEIRKIASYSTDKNYIEGAWLTGDLDHAAFPSAFACYYVPENAFAWIVAETMENVVEIALTELFLVGTGYAGLAALVFVGMMTSFLEAECTNVPENANLGTDQTGRVLWENIDPTQFAQYGSPVGDSFAYDLVSYDELQFQYTDSVTTGHWIGLQFRGVAGYEDLYSATGITTVVTPWVNVWFVA